VGHGGGSREQSALVPVDYGVERVDHPDRAHARVGERRGGGARETEAADDDVEGLVRQLREGEVRELFLRDREGARHQVLLAEEHLEDVVTEHGIEPSAQTNVAARRAVEVELFEAPWAAAPAARVERRRHPACLSGRPRRRRGGPTR
jgi:hypothetical protein